MPHDLELRAAHGEDLVAEPGLVVGAEPLDVDRIMADQLADLSDSSGGCVKTFLSVSGVRKQPTEIPLIRRGGIARRNADDDRALPFAGELVPDGRLGDRSRGGDAQAVVGMVDAVAKAVDAERAGVLAGRHAHPGGHGDRRDDALEPPVGTDLHQAPDVGQVVVAEEQFGGGTVESEDEDLHGKSDSPSIAGPLGTPRAARIVGARSSEPRPLAAERPVHEQDAGDPIGIDDMIAAPLLDVVLELALGDAPHRRRPRDAVSRGEVDQEVGRFLHVRAAIDRLARLRTADGDAHCRARGRPGRSTLGPGPP